MAEHPPPVIAVIGSGPIGVETAVAALRKGFRVILFERGAGVASHVRAWGHVRLFSSNALNVSAGGRATLESLGLYTAGTGIADEGAYPTGAEYVEQYLQPLFDWVQGSRLAEVFVNTEVVSVGRGSLLKGKAIGSGGQRLATPFRLLVRDNGSGEERFVEDVDVVVDSTGTYGNNNFIGKGGLPALGEKKLQISCREASSRIRYTLPDIQGADAAAYSGSSSSSPAVITAVVGCGASAITSLSSLKGLAETGRGGVGVVWITQRAVGDTPYTVLADDPLPQRDALNRLGNALASSAKHTEQTTEAAAAAAAAAASTSAFESFEYKPASQVLSIREMEPGGKLELELERPDNQRERVVVDRVLAHVGYRPDTSLTSELQVHYCYATEGPMKLAAALMSAGGGGGDCLAQVAPGPQTLTSPEPNLFVLGMKSYGRGSAFLLRIGHEQVQSVMELLSPMAPKL